MRREITIIFEHSDDGWWVASIAEVPGALSQGKTIDEARENVLAALSDLMEAHRETAMRERGPGSKVESVSISA